MRDETKRTHFDATQHTQKIYISADASGFSHTDEKLWACCAEQSCKQMAPISPDFSLGAGNCDKDMKMIIFSQM